MKEMKEDQEKGIEKITAENESQRFIFSFLFLRVFLHILSCVRSLPGHNPGHVAVSQDGPGKGLSFPSLAVVTARGKEMRTGMLPQEKNSLAFTTLSSQTVVLFLGQHLSTVLATHSKERREGGQNRGQCLSFSCVTGIDWPGILCVP